jgi:hypothetical protein
MDQDASDMDSSAFIFGVNLVQDVIDSLVTVVISFADSLNTTILGKIREPVTAVLTSFPFSWPKIWNGQIGPAGVTSLGVTNSMRTLRATMPSEFLSPIGNSSTAADFNKVSPLGYGVSRHYLTAWVRTILYHARCWLPYVVLDNIDWESKLNITLPNISTWPVPHEAAVGEPDEIVEEVGRFYRTSINPGDPAHFVVRFPSSGSVNVAGEACVNCYMTFGAYVTMRYTRFVKDDASNDPARIPRVMIPGHFETREETYTLKSFLFATMFIKGDLILGFNKEGDPWLPEICLSLVVDSNGEPIVRRNTVVQTFVDEFAHGQVNNCKQFVENLMAPCPMPYFRTLATSGEPVTLRSLIPDIAILLAPPDLMDLVQYKQRGTDPNSFNYFIQGDLLYWPFDIVEDISSHVF